MGFLIRVEEAGGSVVEEVVADRAFNPVRSGLSSAEFPLLGRLDPYGDTVLDPTRCSMLETEIRGAGSRLEAAGVSAGFLADLARLCAVVCAGSGRRLAFYGD